MLLQGLASMRNAKKPKSACPYWTERACGGEESTVPHTPTGRSEHAGEKKVRFRIPLTGAAGMRSAKKPKSACSCWAWSACGTERTASPHAPAKLGWHAGERKARFRMLLLGLVSMRKVEESKSACSC